MRCGAGSNPGSSVYNGKGMMKTIVYIDGFNLHYGLLRETRFLWLDLEKLVQVLLTDKYEVQKIKYFTARIRSNRFSVISPHDQSCYLDALSSIPRIKIIEGYYRMFRAKLPFAKEPRSNMRRYGRRRRKSRMSIWLLRWCLTHTKTTPTPSCL